MVHLLKFGIWFTRSILAGADLLHLRHKIMPLPLPNPLHFIKCNTPRALNRITTVLRSHQDDFASAGLGPVVQSILSLTSSLRGQLIKCFTTL